MLAFYTASAYARNAQAPIDRLVRVRCPRQPATWCDVTGIASARAARFRTVPACCRRDRDVAPRRRV